MGWMELHSALKFNTLRLGIASPEVRRQHPAWTQPSPHRTAAGNSAQAFPHMSPTALLYRARVPPGRRARIQHVQEVLRVRQPLVGLRSRAPARAVVRQRRNRRHLACPPKKDTSKQSISTFSVTQAARTLAIQSCSKRDGEATTSRVLPCIPARIGECLPAS